jgi:hypothetical protein
MVMTDNDIDVPCPTIDEHKALWVDCEQSKEGPRKVLKDISKKQRPSTKALQTYMEEASVDRMDCGGGWFMTHESVEKVTYSEDVCGSYMAPADMERLKREQGQQKSSFKIVRPTKRPRDASSSP